MSAPRPDAPPRLLLHAFPTFAVGGAQMRFADIANHFGERYRHLIVAMDGVTSASERLDSHVDYQIVPLDVPKGRTFGNYFLLRRHLARLRPDLLVTYNWGAVEWAMANLPPLCRHLHIEDGFGTDESGGQLARRVLFRRAILSPWAQVVLPSRNLYRIASEIWRLPRRRLHYVPNGIDCDRFAQAPDEAMSAELRRRPGELVVGTVAALRGEKNLGRLLDAFLPVSKALPCRLVIVGDGGERKRLEEQAQRLGLGDAVLFTGALRKPESVLGAFDLFALSSDTEQMPYSILEAMAAGLPIAAVDVGDVRAMLSPENGALVVERSADALSRLMLDLLADGARRAALGSANQEHVRRNYDRSIMFARYAELFDA